MSADPRIDEALVHMNAGAWDSALGVLESVLADTPEDAKALRLLGTLHQVNGRLEPAVRFLEASLEADPSAVSGWLNLGSAHLAAGRADRAVEAAERALALDAGSVDALFNLGVALQGTGRIDDAASAYRRLLVLDPSALDARVNLAALALLCGEMREAAELAEIVLESAPEHLQACLCAARALTAIGDADRADTHLAAAERIAPGALPVAAERVEWLLGLGRLPEAEAIVRRALAGAPTQEWPWTALGRVLVETGRAAEAVAHLGAAAARFPGSVPVALLQASAQRTEGDREAALDAARRAVALGPHEAPAHLALGECLADLGAYDAADAAFRRSVELAPRIVLAHDRRVRLALTRRAPADALAICDEYLEDHPSERTLLAARGALLNELGDGAGARALLALDALPDARHVDAPRGYESVDAFNRALEAHVRAHPSLVESPSSHATRNGQHTGNLLAGERGPFDAFEALLWQAVERYLARDVRHPYLDRPPRFERIISWAVLMRRAGHQKAHIHPAAWLSGVYYVRVPEVVRRPGGTEGWLEFGAPPAESYALRGEHPRRQVQPEEGLLVLFPSFLYHHTVPYDADDERLSIAFDVLPQVAAAR